MFDFRKKLSKQNVFFFYMHVTKELCYSELLLWSSCRTYRMASPLRTERKSEGVVKERVSGLMRSIDGHILEERQCV